MYHSQKHQNAGHYHTHTFTWSHCCCFNKSFSSIPNLPRVKIEEGTNKNVSVTASCCCIKVKHVYKIGINCDQISRHGNKDVKKNTIISPWNIYGFVSITNFVVNSFLRGFIRTPVIEAHRRILTEENHRGVWVRQYLSDIRFFQRMPKLMLPLLVNSVPLTHSSKRNFPRWGEAIWYDFR